jgi:hypothetical protein
MLPSGMVGDDCDEDVEEWFNGYTDVPRTLQRVFRYGSRTSNYALAHSFAGELRLPTENMTVRACRFLLVLGESIERARKDDDGFTIAGMAVEHCDLPEMIELLMFFGWENATIPASPVKRLDSEVSQVLARKIGARLDQALRRWADRRI